MRLLRCHIENFGILHDYDHSFDPGLTVLCEENGFGKSTFAAFLKAMFYGFPRTGARNVVENERKRYDPWQGGKYGGFLEFEYQGTQYRVTRYFGRTAAKDSFSMMDLTSRQAAVPFTEKLGEELFQLDAESFARSTYMPQTASRDPEATASIRAKLADLVDDTNDMNNFDTATAALRQCRSRFRAYRGSGGLIGDLEREYQGLEERKFEAEGLRPRLLAVQGEIADLDREKSSETADLKVLRENIRLASAQTAEQLKKERLQALKEAVDRQRGILGELDGRYPQGLPTPEEIKAQRENLSIVQQADRRMERLEVSPEDREILDRERSYFPDLAQAARDIDLCQRQYNALTEVSAKLTDRMLPEEKERWRSLSARFAQGVPDREELERCLTAADAMGEGQLRLASLTLAPERQGRLEALKERFSQGVPEKDLLDACQQAQQDRELLLSRREAARLSEKDQEEYQALRRTFAAGVPGEEEIYERQKDCRRILELTSRQKSQIPQARDEASSKGIQSKAPLLLSILGMALLAAGIVCVALSRTLPGVLLLAGGFVGLLGALWLHTIRAGENRAPINAISDEENQELYDLRRAVNDFLLRYFPDAADPEGKLVRLLLDRRTFAALCEKEAALKRERESIDGALQEKELLLHGVYDRYFPGKPYGDFIVRELREEVREYETLEAQRQELTRQRQELTERIEACRAEIIGLLHGYCPVELPEDLRQGLRDLVQDADAYEALRRKKQAIAAENAGYQAKRQELAGAMEALLTRYGAEGGSLEEGLRSLRGRLEAYKAAAERAEHVERDRQEAKDLRDRAQKEITKFLTAYGLGEEAPEASLDQADSDCRDRRTAETNLHEAQEKLAAFLAENPEARDLKEKREPLPEPEILQEEERGLQARLDDTEARLRDLRQERDSLLRTVENIPGWEDRMARLETQRRQAQRKCELLDRTMALLDQAKDNLANSYVGKVEQGFQRYAETLLGDRLGRVMVDKDLKLYMDEQGAAREVGSFSAGMADSIHLCMRLALIDALFTKEKPFLILDDPFVNLDDAHTKRALEILGRIAQDRQVLYLVCNTSRA